MGRTDIARDPKFRFLSAQAESSKVAKMYAVVPEAPQINSQLALLINECVIGKSTVVATLNTGAEKVHEMMTRAGRKTGRLPDLK